MKSMNVEIIPIWQPQGFSTHQITKKVGEHLKAKATHTGTLDPMAEGVIVALIGDMRLKKFELSGWSKTYEFDIAFGLSTDSYDAMGLLKEDREINIDAETLSVKLSEILKDFEGEYEQEVPLYSAIRYQGKRLFEYAKEGIFSGSLPKKKGVIHDIKLQQVYEVDKYTAVQNIVRRLENIVGDFRQQDITTQWQGYLNEMNIGAGKFILAKIQVEISKGMYIRSLSQDICRKLGIPGFVYLLVRTKNGIYTRKDCKLLEDIFGLDFCDKLFRSGVSNILK